MTMLATMDEDGFCQFASVRNLAHTARVPEESAGKAVAVLEAPDPDSSDPDFEGRRIERVPGGWLVLNGPKYRELATREQIKAGNRKRAQKHRDSKRDSSQAVTPHHVGVTQSDTDTDTDTKGEADAEALPPLQLAHKVVTEGRLPPRSPGLLDSVAGAIDFLAGEGKTRQAAVDFLLDWVRSETARGQPPNRFAFDERKWLRKGGTSAIDEHGGHFEGDVYVDKSGRRMPGYTPPPKPKAKGAGV